MYELSGYKTRSIIVNFMHDILNFNAKGIDLYKTDLRSHFLKYIINVWDIFKRRQLRYSLDVFTVHQRATSLCGESAKHSVVNVKLLLIFFSQSLFLRPVRKVDK